MKRKILMISVLLLAITMLFAVVNTAKAEPSANEEANSVVKVTVGETETYYTDLNEALEAATTGATVTLLKDYEVGTLTQQDGDTKRVAIDGNKTITFDFNGHTISSDSTLVVTKATFVVRGEATVTFKGNGGIVNKNAGTALLVTDTSTVILTGGTLSQTGTSASGKNYATVQCGDNSTLNVNEGTTITADEGSGIYATGESPKVTINGGKITAKAFAVSGNGSDTQNSTIIINDGELTSTDSAAIYHPQSGTLTVTGGTIKGYFGIVSRQGTVKVEGGTITATGTGEAAVGDAKEDGTEVKLPVGAVVTDNKSTGYGDSTKVEVSDGDFTGEIVGYGDNDNNDIELTGGTFKSEEINKEYIKGPEGATLLEVKKGDKFYLGKTAENAVKTAESGTELEVLQGDLELENIHNGVIVKNSGSGNVSLNGQKIKEKPVTVVNEIEQRLAELTAQVEKISEDMAGTNVNITNLKEQLDDANNKITKLKEDASKSDTALQAKIADLERELEELNKKYDALLAEYNANNQQGEDPSGDDPETTPPSSSEQTAPEESPKTGDIEILIASVLILVAILGLLFIAKKTKKLQK